MIDLVIFTGETRHRYLEDTLTCIGAPIGYVVKFDYKSKYLESSNEKHISNYIGKKALLISYAGNLSDKKWYPIRTAEVLAINYENNQLDIALELKELVKLNDNSSKKFYEEFLELTNHHIVSKNFDDSIFCTRSQKDDFENIINEIKTISNKFGSKEIVFSYFEFTDEKGNLVNLEPIKKIIGPKLDVIYYPELNFITNSKHLQLHLFLKAPDIGDNNHLFKLVENLNSSISSTTNFSFGASQIHMKFKINPKEYWTRRLGKLSLNAITSNTVSQRLNFSTSINFSCMKWLYTFILLCVYAFLMSYKFDCPIFEFIRYFILSIITYIAIRWTLRDSG
ncbi:MAG: hypothetical protein KDD50_10860 [Bdellovibrionales bacterium]|nr:hypothetical protein [Bdellovibrionales bacterium]